MAKADKQSSRRSESQATAIIHAEVPGLSEELAEIRSGLATALDMLADIQALLKNPPSPTILREWYTVEDFAKEVGKSNYSVREWCRLGRINAVKRSERRGVSILWSISAQELQRYRNEGLLPVDISRNAGE